MADSKKERFGRYLILDHLVDGGMAKICRARFLGEQADKVVAIKMVQPQFSKDDSFKQMFMDEIKVTFGLIHPNIVQTYDYGFHKDQLFVAMEYCDGRNLKEYLDKLKKRKFVFPVEISVYIISQVCQGLHYAHTLTDKLTGKEMNMVHRDISPHNIMLTYDGAVKIIDFGIAKSESNSEATQAGTIKGKLSYLAPEYLDGLTLDPRYDEFAVGITLWEMLCSRKLFKASNDLAVLKKIQECKIPAPSSINPNVPKELDDIVLKALSKDRNKRYENLDQMNRALMKFLYSTYPDFNGTDLSYFAKELFKEEIKKDREKLFEYGKIDLRPYLDDLKSEQQGGIVEEEIKAKKENVLDFGFEEEKEVKPATRRRALKEASGAQDKLASGNQLSVSKVTKKAKTRSEIASQLETSTKSLTRKKRRRGEDTRKKNLTRTSVSKEESLNSKGFGRQIAGVIVFALLGAGGFFFYQNQQQFNEIVSYETNKETQVPDRGPSSNITKDLMGKVRLKGIDRYKQKVFVDGKPANLSVLNEISVPKGKEVNIRVETPGLEHFVSKFQYQEDARNNVTILKTNPAYYGYLMTSRNCANGSLEFELYGEKRTEVVPIAGQLGIPFPVNVDDQGRPIKTKYDNVFFDRSNNNLQQRLEFTIEHEASVDLCDFIE